MSWTKRELIKRVDQLTQVDENQIKDKQSILSEAMDSGLERYNRDQPRYEEQIATGVTDQIRYNLPSTFDPNFSTVVRVEKPFETATDKRSTPLDHRDWLLYENDFVTYQIDFIGGAPDSTTQYRVLFTIPHILGSIPAVHTQAFSFLCASLVCSTIGASFANQRESTMAADTVDNRQSVSSWEVQARSFMKQYERVVFRREDQEVKAAAAESSVSSLFAQQSTRIIHRERP